MAQLPEETQGKTGGQVKAFTTLNIQEHVWSTTSKKGFYIKRYLSYGLFVDDLNRSLFFCIETCVRDEGIMCFETKPKNQELTSTKDGLGKLYDIWTSMIWEKEKGSNKLHCAKKHEIKPRRFQRRLLKAT